jgi:putative heme-binding domain-containing protein
LRPLRSIVFGVFAAALVAVTPTSVHGQHAGAYTQADIEAGARLYGAHCSACHGPEGDTVATVDLRRGQFRLGNTDEDLARTITRGIPGTAMPPNSFRPAELSALIAYIRSMREFGARAVTIGDAATGRALFDSKGCGSCHRVFGRGSRFAADLSDIGSIRSGDALQRALLDFSGSVTPQRRFVRAVTTDGRVVSGRRLNEDSFTVQLLDDKDRLVSLTKADLREYKVFRATPVAAGKEKLSVEDRSHLIAYLLQLRGLETASDKPAMKPPSK